MKHKQDHCFRLCFSAIGVVYGDIGTSPLYAIKACFRGYGLSVTPLNVLGIISLCLWCLALVVGLKYVTLALRVDHQGEGGTLALASLVASRGIFPRLALALGICGAALFFGDGVLTPAISILSAVEGLSLLHPYGAYGVVPLTLIILTALFAIQRWGTSRIGHLFGPVMVLWFLILGSLGIYQILKNPFILKALNPYYAVYFLKLSPLSSMGVMGTVLLVVTGAEALYADLGHFGRRPIALSWHGFVFPALVLNYLGQGALLLRAPFAVENLFYLMAPEGGLWVLILLSTLATIIASQAVVSGIFSVTYHSMCLNYLPKLKRLHTSTTVRGQIYISAVNSFIYGLTVLAVLLFQSSENLSLAYGLCVAKIMLVTTLLLLLYYGAQQNPSRWISVVLVPILMLEVLFILSNISKFFHGGWYVLGISAFVCYSMWVWRKGSVLRQPPSQTPVEPLDILLRHHLKDYPQRLPGAAFFLASRPDSTPLALLAHMQHNTYLHEKVFILFSQSLNIPYCEAAHLLDVQEKLEGCYVLHLYTGFMQRLDLHSLISTLIHQGCLEKEEPFSIFLSKKLALRSEIQFFSGFSENLYYYLSLLSQQDLDLYTLPQAKVLELGVPYAI